MIRLQHVAEQQTWTTPTSNRGIDWVLKRVQTQTERSNEIKHRFLTSSKASKFVLDTHCGRFFFRGRKQCSVTSHAHSTSIMIKTQLTAEPATHGTAPRSHRARGGRGPPGPATRCQLTVYSKPIWTVLLIHNENYILACQVPGHKTNFNGITCFLAATHNTAQAHK